MLWLSLTYSTLFIQACQLRSEAACNISSELVASLKDLKHIRNLAICGGGEKTILQWMNEELSKGFDRFHMFTSKTPAMLVTDVAGFKAGNQASYSLHCNCQQQSKSILVAIFLSLQHVLFEQSMPTFSHRYTWKSKLICTFFCWSLTYPALLLHGLRTKN